MRPALRVISCAILVVWGCVPKISKNDQLAPQKPNDSADSNKAENEKRLKDLENQVLALTGVQTQINSIIQSDFATCPNSGDTADALINKICKVAQAANVESRVQLKGELSQYLAQLSAKIGGVNTSLVTLRADFEANAASVTAQIAAINTAIGALQSDIFTLQSQMSSAQSAIAALQALTASIAGSIAGSMQSFDVGSENVAAGPLYETLLRDTAKTRINAYVEGQETPVSLPGNPVVAVNGSSTVTINYSAAHSLVVGNVISLSGLNGAKGFTDADLVGDHPVLTVPSTTSITVALGRNASAGGAFGGSSGIATKISGRAMGTIWKVADGADAAVRQTTIGTLRYNFIVKANGDVCYSTTVASATFATISAGGVGVTCK